jgi:hypothetical protein
MKGLFSVIAGIILAIGLSGCGTTDSLKQYDIPPQIVKWSQDNVWQIITEYGSGSGFSISEDTVITACHVVSRYNHEEASVPLHILQDRYGKHPRMAFMVVKSCNKETDIAVLTWIHGDPLNSTFQGFHPRPAMGKGVWGTGHALGGDLEITQGHAMREERQFPEAPPNTFYTTTLTLPGDSGSALVALYDGVPLVIGVRYAVRQFRLGFANVGLAMHLTLVSPTRNILAELHKDVEGY